MVDTWSGGAVLLKREKKMQISSIMSLFPLIFVRPDSAFSQWEVPAPLVSTGFRDLFHSQL